MDGFSIFNGTNCQIFITIFDTQTNMHETAWLNPLCKMKPPSQTNNDDQQGRYHIYGEIISSEENIKITTSVIINLPSKPIKIETDECGNFWWKTYQEK